MEAPTPVIFKPKEFNKITPKFEIKKEKEYEIKYNNHKYNLKMKIDSNYIFFKLFEIKENDMIQICYKNKFDLKTITNLLMLHPFIYNDLDKVISLLGECYNLNKLSLTIDENNTKIIAKIMNGNIETECSINLIETKIEIEDKFDMILNDIKFLKTNMNTLVENKLLGLETMLKDIQKLTKQKLEENENKIKELSSKIEQYKCQFEKNKNNINLIQNDLNEIKQIKLLLNKYLVGQVINDNINIDLQKEIIKSDKIDNKVENIATPLHSNIENLEKNVVDINEKKENSNNIEYMYSFKEGDINQRDNNEENNNSNHNKDLSKSISSLNNNKNMIKKRTSFKNPKKFTKRGSMKETLKKNFLSDKYSTETPQNNIIIEENDIDKEENIDKQKDLKGKYISDDDDSDDSNNGYYYSKKDIRNQTETNITSIYSSTRLKSKNKTEHYKKKLGCIIEDINAPIPNTRKIPKIKIFKGFSKEIEKERKSY